MGKNRFPRAGRRNALKLYSRGGECVRHHVAREEGMRKVREGQWLSVRDPETKELIGFQLAQCRNMTASLENVPTGAVAKVSSRAISHAEREALVGLRGESRTARLTEKHKQELMERAASEGRRFEPEDFIERSLEKVKVYAGTH